MATHEYVFAGYDEHPGKTPVIRLELLREAALRHFAKADMADLWMRSTNPVLGYRRPAELAAIGAEELERCIGLLKNQKGRRS